MKGAGWVILAVLAGALAAGDIYRAANGHEFAAYLAGAWIVLAILNLKRVS